jgi:rod shape-determining protein MreC
MQALIEKIGDARVHFITALILIGAITMVVFRYDGGLNNVRRVSLAAFSYLEQPLSQWRVYRKALQTNEELRRQNIQLLDEVSRLRSARYENEELRELLGYRDSSRYDLYPIVVVGKEITGLNNILTINAGSNADLDIGMPVVNSSGLIGRIILTGRNRSVVMPYIDIRSRISAKLQGLQTGGIVSWEGKRVDELIMSTIPRTVQVDSGMVVETSGFSNDLPANIPIGVVVRTVPDPGKDTQTLYLRPFVNLFDVSEGFVIRFRPDTAVIRLQEIYLEQFQ